MPSKRDTLIDFASFVQAYPKTGPFLLSDAFCKLSRLGKEAHSYAERLCNFGERSEGEYDRKCDSLSRRAYAALATLGSIRGVEVETGGDPRGSCLKVRIPRDSVGTLEVRF